jgi:hypothetical protein
VTGSDSGVGKRRSRHQQKGRDCDAVLSYPSILIGHSSDLYAPIASYVLYQESWGLTDVGPFSHADRGDHFWLGEEFAPSVAGDVDDVFVSFEDEV